MRSARRHRLRPYARVAGGSPTSSVKFDLGYPSFSKDGEKRLYPLELPATAISASYGLVDEPYVRSGRKAHADGGDTQRVDSEQILHTPSNARLCEEEPPSKTAPAKQCIQDAS